jgi:hypothetical protein
LKQFSSFCNHTTIDEPTQIHSSSLEVQIGLIHNFSLRGIFLFA